MLLQAMGQMLRRFVTGGPLSMGASKQAGPRFPDIAMPGMDGFEAARRIRETAFHDIVLVALSGYGHYADRRRAFAAGFDQYLTKPVNMGRLANCCPTGHWPVAATTSRNRRKWERGLSSCIPFVRLVAPVIRSCWVPGHPVVHVAIGGRCRLLRTAAVLRRSGRASTSPTSDGGAGVFSDCRSGSPVLRRSSARVATSIACAGVDFHSRPGCRSLISASSPPFRPHLQTRQTNGRIDLADLDGRRASSRVS